MSFYDRILKLRAIRAYSPDPLTDDDLTAILEAGRWTGSAKNRQDWAFVVVRDPAQKQKLAAAGSFSAPVRDAPVAVALVQERGAYEFDIGRAAQNIMLAADAVGVASCPVTLHREEKAHEVLGLGEGQRCRYAVALGYPAGDARPARVGGRKPLSAVVHDEVY